MSAIAAQGLHEAMPGRASGFNLLPHRVRTVRLHRRRAVIDGAAALLVGALIGVGWAVVGAQDDRARVRHAELSREIAQLAPALDELARLERAAQSANAGARQAAARVRPYVELRSLLGALSSEAHAGVTVDSLRQTNEGIELRVRAAESAACASWVDRLARKPGVGAAEIVDFKSTGPSARAHAERFVEAIVRVRSSDTRGPSPVPRIGADTPAHTDRSGR